MPMLCWLRSCVMERMFALELEMMEINLTNSPGWSGITVSKKTLRHVRIKPLLMTRDILLTSMLAAADQSRYLLVADTGNLAVHESCNRYGASAFCNGLNAFDEPEDCCGNFRFVDRLRCRRHISGRFHRSSRPAFLP